MEWLLCSSPALPQLLPCLVYEVQNLARTTCRFVCISALRFHHMNLGWKDQLSPLSYLHSKDPMPAISRKLDQVSEKIAVKNVVLYLKPEPKLVTFCLYLHKQ